MASATIAVPVVQGKKAPAVQLRNILFATDFSEYSRQALPYVTGLAWQFGSNVFLCHVAASSQLMFGASDTASYLYEAWSKKSAEDLLNMARSPELAGLKIEVVLASGRFEEELNKAIHENQIDLMVVGSSGQTVQGPAQPICRIVPCPVLTVGPEAGLREEMQFRRILVPTDFSDESTKILAEIRDIARDYGSSITFLHVIPAAANIDAHRLADGARRIMNKVFAEHGFDHRPEFVFEFGQTAETILRAAKEYKVDLIAMRINPARASGIYESSGIVDQIVAGARCPVLTCL